MLHALVVVHGLTGAVVGDHHANDVALVLLRSRIAPYLRAFRLQFIQAVLSNVPVGGVRSAASLTHRHRVLLDQLLLLLLLISFFICVLNFDKVCGRLLVHAESRGTRLHLSRELVVVFAVWHNGESRLGLHVEEVVVEEQSSFLVHSALVLFLLLLVEILEGDVALDDFLHLEAHLFRLLDLLLDGGVDLVGLAEEDVAVLELLLVSHLGRRHSLELAGGGGGLVLFVALVLEDAGPGGGSPCLFIHNLLTVISNCVLTR